jgi:hypothetical protein
VNGYQRLAAVQDEEFPNQQNQLFVKNYTPWRWPKLELCLYFLEMSDSDDPPTILTPNRIK